MAQATRKLRLAPRPAPSPVHHPRPSLGNSDASRFFDAGAAVSDSNARAGHAQSAPRGCSDSAVRRRAARHDAPVHCTAYRSSAALGRSRCTPALRRDSERTRIVVRSSLQQQASALPLDPRTRAALPATSMDLIVRRCNTLPALVANTVGRGGPNNLPVAAVAAPVLRHRAVLPLLRAATRGILQAHRRRTRQYPSTSARPHAASLATGGGLGGTPSQGLRQSRQASGSDLGAGCTHPAGHQRGNTTHAARAPSKLSALLPEHAAKFSARLTLTRLLLGQFQ
jgi:hypothetical protein